MRWALSVLIVFAFQDDVVKKTVPDADKIRKVAKKISRESRDKIEKALGEKLAETDLAPPLWECYSTIPTVSSMERTRCLVTVVTVKGPKGPIKVGVAAATLETTLHAVKILENGDDKAIESKLFLTQFEGLEYTPNVWNPSATLAAAIRKATEGKDDAAKETDTILRMNAVMRTMGPAWDRLMDKIEKQDRTALDEVAAMDRAFEESIRMVPGAKFMKPTQIDKYKGYATGARGDLADVKNLLTAGKYEEAQKRAGPIDSDRCAKCHAAYRRSFREARLDRNLGNGYFSTKLEVGMPDPKSEASYQAVGNAIRKGILLATEAK